MIYFTFKNTADTFALLSTLEIRCQSFECLEIGHLGVGDRLKKIFSLSNITNAFSPP